MNNIALLSHRKEEPENGILYIVGTPIGNLGDITLRSLNLLSTVDFIICEDTRVSKKLTNKYGIGTQLKPFHKFNSKRAIPGIIKKLQSGLNPLDISKFPTSPLLTIVIVVFIFFNISLNKIGWFN